MADRLDGLDAAGGGGDLEREDFERRGIGLTDTAARAAGQLALRIAVCAALVAAAPAFGQSQDAGGERPDFSGVWQALNTANWELEAHNAEAGNVPKLGALLAIPPGPGVVVGGRIPYLEAAMPQREENRRNRWTDDPELRCYMPGVPRANYMPYPFQIIQGTDVIMVSYQFADAVRLIHLEDPGPAPAPSWMGWNVGRWEGDTLVVEVTDLMDQTWLDRSGNYHSEALEVVERYTLETPNIIMYEATLTDPEVFAEPWTIRMPLYRHVQENAQVMPFKCIPFVEELIYGDIGR